MTTAKLHRLMPDTVFAGAYRVERAIGEGAMGTVYLAHRIDGTGRCALKVLKPSIASDQSKATERFGREARVGDKIGSPHIVVVFSAGFDEATGLHWLAMEYLDGLAVSDFLEQHKPDAQIRHRIVGQLFSAMGAAHRAGVIHRDLKPENLFVVSGPQGPELKVLDFGVAKTLRSGLVASATEGGLGTPLWTAPEQGKGGDHIQLSVDVWALGLLTFFILTGKLYWRNCNVDGASMLDIAVEMLRSPIESASVRAAQLGVGHMLPAGIDPWFESCVVRDVNERYADASRAEEAWNDVVRGVKVAPLKASMPPQGPVTLRSHPPVAPKKRHLTLIVVAALIAGLIAAAIAFIMLR